MKIQKKIYDKVKKLLPILCVDCLVIRENKCLLLHRLKHPAKNKWWFPGGRVFKNELIKDAAERKISSETNLDAKFKKVISIEETIFSSKKNINDNIHTVNVCCLLVSKNFNNIKIDSDHDKYLWADIYKAKNLSLDSAVMKPILKVLKQKY